VKSHSPYQIRKRDISTVAKKNADSKHYQHGLGRKEISALLQKRTQIVNTTSMD
jgi:hypothetical protein